MKELVRINLALHEISHAYTNKTTDTTASTGNDLSPEMKTYYSDYLIKLMKAQLVHDQFGQKHPIPKNGGQTIEFRQFKTLGAMTAPLEEGKTPDGQKLNVTTKEAKVHQYGGFVEISDVLILTAIDNNLQEATRLIADQAALTYDRIVREILNAGTNVLYANGGTSRNALVGGDATAANNNYISVKDIRLAVRKLTIHNAKRIGGYYVAIIHPDISFDLMSDPEWKYPHQYKDTVNIYNGEIGELAGVRFVETTEAKVFHAQPLTPTATTLTVASYTSGTKTVVIDEALTADEATALAGRSVIIHGEPSIITSATSGSAGSATIVLKDARTTNPADNDVVYPGEAGAAGRNVYSTLIIAENAYGVTDVEGGGLEHIVKQVGSAGTADPLNQRATCGWKGMFTAEILVEDYMIRVESTSTFADTAPNW